MFILMATGAANVNAQNRGSQVKTELNNLKTQLKMDYKSFQEFRHNLALFNDSMSRVMNNTGLKTGRKDEGCGSYPDQPKEIFANYSLSGKIGSVYRI